MFPGVLASQPGAAKLAGSSFLGKRRCLSVASPSRSSRIRQAARADSAPAVDASKKFDARAFRRSLNQTDRYVRNPWKDADSIAEMERDGSGYSKTGLLAKMRENGNKWEEGKVSLILAEAMGYCWGVERAVQMAYEAVNAYPGKQLHLTNEIIHNPGVNQKMSEKGYNFIDTNKDGEKDFSGVKEGDVVLLPAFGASVEEMRLLKDRNVQIVDTTCPWVSKVWNAVDRQTKKNHTSIIHGKWSHEETVATASFASDYVIVRDIGEAEYVCDYILNGGDREEFMKKFVNAHSAGFDPDTMLERVGLANQTTMLKGETEAIGKLLEKTVLKKYGPEGLKEHFMVMDTICDATQERQDAMYEMTKDDAPKLDMILVVGGFNSSNTSHLQEIGELANITSYWIDSPDRINIEERSITWQASNHDKTTTKDFLPEGNLVIGVTSGASTPDRAVELCLEKIFHMQNA
ncbi:hypothetical protein BSKO_12303 [Bryopsis sp. KO-2023]|nr:hypothetical protein BSKO_12303 [Bryopsis sp. KO-2023]